MYYAVVLLLMLIFPLGSIFAELHIFQSQTDILFLVGKWFVFWAVGIRLLTAGLRQILQPEFTAKEIFGLQHAESTQIVQELGFSNLCVGVLGAITIFNPAWIMPAVITGGLFFGMAGIRHVMSKERGGHEIVAMVSDLGIALIMAVYVGIVFLG